MNTYEKNDDIKELIANLIKKINEEANNDPYTANYMVNLFEQRILDLKSPYLSYVFAYYIKGADVKAHKEVILASKDPVLCYLALGLDNEDFYPDVDTVDDIKRLDGLIKKINH